MGEIYAWRAASFSSFLMLLFLFLVLLLTTWIHTTRAIVVDCTWTNGGDIYQQGFWSEAANWDCGHAPGSGDVVIFNGAVSNDGLLINVPSAEVKDFRIINGYSGVISGGTGTLDVSGSWRNDVGSGAMSFSTRHVRFDGNSQQNIIGTSAFGDLTLFDTGPRTVGFELSRTQTVSGTFTADVTPSSTVSIRSVNSSGTVQSGSTSILDVTNGMFGTVDYLDIRDNHLYQGGGVKNPPLTPPNSTDNGNSDGWFTQVPLDSDGDGITDDIEDAGPNGGDANGDEFADKFQSSVGTTTNPVTGGHTTLDLEAVFNGQSECTTIDSFSVVSEDSLSTSDSSADYPVGLNSFTLDCENSGDTATLTILYDQVYDTSTWVYKKFNASTNTFIDISSFVTYGTKDVGGTTVTTVMYDVTDGGPLDLDGTANSTIVDPSGASEESSSDSDDSDPERASVRKFMSHDNREMLRVVIYGDDFDKDARVKLSGVKAEKVRRKSEEKIVALFDFGEVKAMAERKGRTKFRVAVKNPGGDKNRVDKRIDISDIDPLAHDKYHRVYKGEKRNAWRLQAIANAVARGW